MTWLLMTLRNSRQLIALLAIVFGLFACNSYIPGWDDCGDKMDNDNDGLVDAHDPGCANGGDESYNPPAPDNGNEDCPEGTHLEDGECVPNGDGGGDTDGGSDGDVDCNDYWEQALWACQSQGLVMTTYQCQENSNGTVTLNVGCSSADEGDIIVEVTVVVEGDTSSSGGSGDGGGDVADCNDGYDNDGDGFIDYPADPGCTSTSDTSEVNSDSGSDPACSDGIDNDGDGYIDYGSDPGCSGPSDNDETDSGGGEFTDDLGSYGCPRAYSSAISTWLSTYGIPTGIVLNDTDADGNYDELYMLGSTLDIVSGDIELLDVEPADFAVDSQWNNCEGWSDGTDDATDDDGDGWSEVDGDCDDRSSGNHPGAEEVCGDAFDNDCDGIVDESCEVDGDGDGYTPLEGDCDDNEAATNPTATEWGDGNDNDCDGEDL